MPDPAWQKLLAERNAIIAAQAAEIQELKALVEELRARLGMNSLNSSLAPSRDDAEAREKRRAKAAEHARRRKKEARRKNRSKRSLLPPEMVTSSEEHRPRACDCGHRFRLRDLLTEPERIQKLDLPELRPLVHEIRLFSAHCPCCDEVTSAPRPPAADTTKVGPGLRALMVLLLGRFHLSRRDVVEFLADVLSVDVSLGLLSKIESQVTAGLDAPYQEALAATQKAAVVYADETSWSHGGIPGWLWVATTGHVACFRIDARRGRDAADKLLGPDVGVTVSDRWVAYETRGRRQLCWAHLERNAQALVDYGGKTARVGHRVIAFIKKMFRLWHRFLDAAITRRGLRSRVKTLGAKLLRGLARARDLTPRAQTFVDGLLRAEPHLFTFTEVEGVEPTNNTAERDLRAPVMWRRKSQATRSERGRRFVERILTVVMSLRAQGRSVFAFLRDALHPDITTPSLLPTSATP